MRIRVLVAVLTLLGSMPLRVCTCGAAHSHSPEPAPHETGHTHHPDGDIDHAAPGGHHPNRTAPAGHSHDPDCHAVNPRPIIRDALADPHPVDPTHADGGLQTAALVPTPATPHREGVAPRAVPPGVPLYLSLLVLRL